MTDESAGSRIASAFAAIPEATALAYLHQYYGLGAWENRAYTGSHFDYLPVTSTDIVTAEDIIAVACLSIHVPAAASVKIIREQAAEIACLLADIPNANLEDVPFDEHDSHLGAGTSALRLWKLLRNHHGVGQTTTSKLMARKRPGLIPIYDSVVGRVTGFPNADGTWRAWHKALTSKAELVAGLRSLRDSAGLESISLLRILDVILWMDGSKGVEEPERIDDEIGTEKRLP